MEKIIGLFLILGIGAALLTSCFKAKYYGGRTKITGGTTFNITSSNGIPTNINYTITETQIVQGASFEIKASNAIPVQLEAPTNSWSIQVTNPISLQLNQTGAIQANLTITNKFENTNFGVTITLKLDSALTNLLPSTITITSAPISLNIHLPKGTIGQVPDSNDSSSWLNFFEWLGNAVGKWLSDGIGKLFFQICVPLACIIIGGALGKITANKIFAPKTRNVFFGIAAAALIPAFARIIPGNLLISSSEDMLATITLFSFCFLAGMLGIEFIQSVIGLLRGLINKANREQDLNEKLIQIQAAFENMEPQLKKLIASNQDNRKEIDVQTSTIKRLETRVKALEDK